AGGAGGAGPRGGGGGAGRGGGGGAGGAGGPVVGAGGVVRAVAGRLPASRWVWGGAGRAARRRVAAGLFPVLRFGPPCPGWRAHRPPSLADDRLLPWVRRYRVHQPQMLDHACWAWGPVRPPRRWSRRPVVRHGGSPGRGR